jgi:hypothetical protein
MSDLALAARQDGSRADASVLWLGADQVPSTIAAALLTRGVRIAEGEPHTGPLGRIALVDKAMPRRKAAKRPDLANRRILVLHSDAEQANLLSWALSARGALTRTFDGAALDATSAFDADVVLVDHAEFFAACWDDVCAMWRHPRLRWTPSVLLPWAQLEAANEADLDAVCLTVQRLCTEYDLHVTLARNQQPFQMPVDVLGPARTLRTVLEQRSARHVRLATPRVTIDVHVADRIVLGARGRFTDGSSIELSAARALACLVAEEAGMMQVFPQREAPLSNVLASFDDALVRGPDGAWLSESVVAGLPNLPDLTDPCGFDDETLFARRTSSASGVCEKQSTAPLAPAPHLHIVDDEPEPMDESDVEDDDEEGTIATLRFSSAELLAQAAQAHGRSTRSAQAFAAEAPAKAAPRLALVSEAAAPAASEPAQKRPALRCKELPDERPSGIRLKRSRARPLFSSLLALSLLVAGVLCVESDQLAAEQLLIHVMAQTESWLTAASHQVSTLLR